jgi:hypothetical protein
MIGRAEIEPVAGIWAHTGDAGNHMCSAHCQITMSQCFLSSDPCWSEQGFVSFPIPGQLLGNYFQVKLFIRSSNHLRSRPVAYVYHDIQYDESNYYLLLYIAF